MFMFACVYNRTILLKVLITQECIPVGCVPPAAVAVCWGGVCLSACWDTPPGVGLETPPQCGPGDTPRPDPSTSPWVWAWRPARHARIPPPPGYLKGMLGYHLQCMLGYHPPLSTEFLTHTSENITLPQIIKEQMS